MSPISELKRFMLRALLRLNGVPWPDELLEAACLRAVTPRPLLSELRQAKRELERGGYIHGSRDDLDGGITWTLTEKGRHRGEQEEKS